MLTWWTWWIVATARAGVPDTAFDAAVDYIDRYYLYPDAVTPQELLQAAALGLADEVDWLMVSPTPRGVALRHGNGRTLGEVSVDALRDLPSALRAVEGLVRDSGYDTGDVDVALALLDGSTDALDRYTKVLAGDPGMRFETRLRGTLVGIGVELDASAGDALRVTGVTAGGPADLGGLRANDRIVRIDGQSTVNMPVNEASKLIQGDAGTDVRLALLRDGAALELTLTRAEVVVSNVEWKVLPGNVGYVRISYVTQRTLDNLEAALASLRSAGALNQGLVIDVRGNTGGSMREAARSADAFVEAGTLLVTRGRNGLPVDNVQERADAVRSGREPLVPIAVVVDDRTASGAEILVGNLLESGRAVLVGGRTYGKGTVQKQYDLDANETRLKLTVARYFVMNDRAVADVGMVPDAVVGEIALDGDAVRYSGWDEAFERTPWERILPDVRVAGGAVAEPDIEVELARRAVLGARSPARADVLVSLAAAAKAVGVLEDAELVAALAARGIDWTPAAEEGSFTDAAVAVTARPDPARPGTMLVTATVRNLESEPLARALVQLECASSNLWDGVVIPLGAIPGGATVTGTTAVEILPGVDPREDPVGVRLRADRRPPFLAAETVLRSASEPIPAVAARARLLPAVPGAAGRRAEVVVRNLGDKPLAAVDVHFGYPGDLDVELVDAAARVEAIPPRGEARFELGLALGARAPALLPLQVEVAAEGYGTLASWPLRLPADGVQVALQAPRIDTSAPLSTEAGAWNLPFSVTDDRRVDHVVAWLDGAKVQWSPGGAAQVASRVSLELTPGVHRVVLVAADDQGLVTRRQVVVRAVERAAPSADAGAP